MDDEFDFIIMERMMSIRF